MSPMALPVSLPTSFSGLPVRVGMGVAPIPARRVLILLMKFASIHLRTAVAGPANFLVRVPNPDANPAAMTVPAVVKIEVRGAVKLLVIQAVAVSLRLVHLSVKPVQRPSMRSAPMVAKTVEGLAI